MLKNTVITLVVHEALDYREKQLVQQLLADALYGFRKARMPAREYFERAYGDLTVYKTEEERESKIEDIEERNRLAEKLFGVSHGAKVEVVDVKPQVKFIGDGMFEVRHTDNDGIFRRFEDLPKNAQVAMRKRWDNMAPGLTANDGTWNDFEAEDAS